MAAKPVSFRLPSKYVVFLDAIAAENGGDRTKVLIQILEGCLKNYLSNSSVR
jgi:predicted AAA+ superfamily ATPase